ncbi:MAG: protease inhibitor I42 family protein [Sphingobacteriales bacterium]|nr:MAG: protease inhibitor I42 family protein [Sphingobacteriales bacterium]
MKTVFLFCCLVFILLIVNIACNTCKKSKSEPVNHGYQTDVSSKNELPDTALMSNLFTLEHTGQVAKLKVGDTLNLLLKSNPTTGYSWKIVQLDSLTLQNTGEKYIPYSTEPNITGSGGNQWYSFKTIKHGNTKISIVYKRPWEKQTTDLPSFELDLEIEP